MSLVRAILHVFGDTELILNAGDTPVQFGMLSSPLSTGRFFRKIEADPNLALLTVNDDVKIKAEMVDKMFRDFLDRRWQFPSAWEEAQYTV